MNDAVLVEQTLAGDYQAFNGLITDHYASIYGIILSWVKEPEDAKDLTQDVFISAYLDLPSLRDYKQFHSWLHQIARHRCQNWKRKQIDLIPLNNDLISKEPSADDVIIQREKLAKVMEAIDELPESEKRLLKERYLDGISYDELSARHGVSTKALVVRLVRTRRKIRDYLEKTLSAFVAFLHRHSESILTGGVEIMKLSVKTKLIAGGVLAILILGGAGVLIRNQYIQNESEQIVSETPQEAYLKTPAKSVSSEGKSLIKDDNLADKKAVTQINPQVEEQKSNIVDASNKTEAPKTNNLKEEKQNQELIKKTKEYSELAGILPEIIKLSIKTVQLINEQSKRKYTDDEWSQLVGEIEDGIRKEIEYYKQIGNMFPDLNLYTEWSDPEALDQMNYQFNGDRLLEYFGKDPPWDGKTRWRDLMDRYSNQI